MNAEQAVQAVDSFQPTRALPYHWGAIVGDRSDADHLAQHPSREAVILNLGGILNL